MEYKQLGNTGVKVSELCLGTMTFGRETDEKTSRDIVSRFLDKGGNFIDSADIYGAVPGASEEVVGRALKGKRSKVILTAKVGFGTGPGPNDRGLSRVHIMQAIEASLHRLQTDYLDFYFVHCWDGVTPLEETLATLNELVKVGKVRYLGVSNFTGWQIMKALGISERRGWQRFVCFQPQYNLLVRDIERELMPLCGEERLGIVTWAPLAGGFLSGKYSSRKPLSKDGRLVRVKKEDTDSWKRRVTKRSLRILKVVEEVAKKRGKKCAQVALAWISLQPGITAPIIGARTVQQLEENMGCLGCRLTQEEIKALDEVSQIEEGYPYRFVRELSRR